MSCWSLHHLDLDDEINSDIWHTSVVRDEMVRRGRPSKLAETFQGVRGLPWVPDLVGRRWREADAVHLIGSAYSPFVDGSRRGRTMPIHRYLGSRTSHEFQVVFDEFVVDPDGDYYSPLATLMEAAAARPEQFVLSDLVRACFVRAGTEDGGDGAVRADPDLFMDYAREGWPWTWKRLKESQATAVVALGNYAEHGLLKLLAEEKLTLRVPQMPDIRPPAPHKSVIAKTSKATRKAWLSMGAWWEASGVVEGRERVWRILPVYHPAYLAAWNAGYQLTTPALRSMLSRRELTPAGAPLVSSTAPPSAPSRADVRHISGARTHGYWPIVLRPGPPTGVGDLLASHPDATALTTSLLTGLTITRLVAIADALYNKCRVGDMEERAPRDLQRQSRLAWQALADGAGKTYRQPSGWTGAVRLLEEGHMEGLATVARLDIGAVTRVGARIVSGPYSDAVARGVH